VESGVESLTGLGSFSSYPALPSLCENASYAPLGLSHFPLAPRASALGCILAPLRGWNYDSLATCGLEFEFSHRLFRAGLSHTALAGCILTVSPLIPG